MIQQNLIFLLMKQIFSAKDVSLTAIVTQFVRLLFVTRKIQGCFNDVSRNFQGFFKAVLRGI